MNDMKWLTKGILVSIILFVLGAGTVMANENEQDQLETVEFNSEAAPTEETETVVEGTEQEPEQNAEEFNSDQEPVQNADEFETGQEPEQNPDEFETVVLAEPALIPGDFFYFVKTMIEDIRLALTVDDYKEAQMLAEFAAERIAEANALLAEGETSAAEELLQEAISTQERAGEKLPESEEELGTETETADAVVTEETDHPDESEESVDSKLAHNIDSLLVVLDKVENPTAQQAMMKNIQKSFAKLEKKITKMEKAKSKVAVKASEAEEKTASGEMTEEEATQDQANLEEEQELEKEAAKEVEEVNQAVAKQGNKAAEEAKKAAEKQREDAIKAAEKKQAEAKQKAEEQRKEAEKNREAAKQKSEAAKNKGQEKKQNNE